MTTRCYSSTRQKVSVLVGFVVIVMIVAGVVHFFSWLGVGQSSTEPWLIRSSTPATPTVSTTAVSLMHQLHGPSPGTGVLVESERVRPFETPPNDTWPDAGSVGQGTAPGELAPERPTNVMRLPQPAGSDSSRTISSVSDGNTSTNSIISNNVGKDGSTELINVTKVTILPLHDDDLLYESKPDAFDGQQWAPNTHRTGVFRSKSSKIWDPHPEYKIRAFGMSMHLKLIQDAKFIGKDMKETHVWDNETLRKDEDHLESKQLQACFYKGNVVGDKNSHVRVSLCDGMHGHIRTSNGSFFIEPVENASSSNNNVLHRIQRLSLDKIGFSADRRIEDEGSSITAQDCAVKTEHQIAGRYLEAKQPAVDDSDGVVLPQQHSGTDPGGVHRRSKRSSSYSSTDEEYTIEVLVAVDNKMQRYHGNALKSYVLTLMSIVSSVYADASIGNSIKIAVSHIMYIHHDLAAQNKSRESGWKGVSATHMLQDFCHLKQTTNFHHDAALILTREQICREPAVNNCETLGLAELGTICRPTACAIVQDNGLSASFTIAHELGHVLGMPHDDDSRCQRFRGNPVLDDRIMSRTIDHNTHPWQWSSCSRHILTEYLEKNPNNCLLNHPTKDLIDLNEKDPKLAGEKFTNNKQCELVFGSGYRICSYMPVCTRLWCSTGDENLGCRTQHMPWADGTECSEGHWCQKGQCVPIDRTALQPQNGGWSHWSSFGPCSRTCGGGIQNRTRECDSPRPRNGGKFCTGVRIDYRACNTQPCPDSRYNFREQQCREHDGQNFDVPNLEQNVRWTSKYGTTTEEQCKLYCRVQDQNLYFLLREKVVDGTPCTFPEDSFDMCINGQCRKAGCDYELDSDAKLDRCGVCNGDNSTCREVHGYLPLAKPTKQHKPPDNMKEFNIPQGATNINITHEGFSKERYLILCSTCDNDWVFNDPKHPPSHNNKHRLFAGVRLEYTTLGNHIERITSAFGRPLREKLTVKLIYQSNYHKFHHQGQVSYSYLIPIYPGAAVYQQQQQQQQQPQQQHHSHHSSHQQYSHPHHHHGHGQQQPSYSPNSVQQRPQQRHPEPTFSWNMSSWMECDQPCSGKRRRTAICFNADTEQEVSPDNCSESVKPQDLYEPCNTQCKFYWEPGRPDCSVACGNGTMTVEHRCVRSYLETGTKEYIDSSLCKGIQKPIGSREQCTGSCKEAVWSYSPWNTCSCKDERQNRSATCLSEPNGFEIDDSYCAERQEKIVVRSCIPTDCPTWEKGEPTPCSVTCGEGQRAYALQCKLNNVSVNAALCGTRPVAVLINCTMPPCESKPSHNPLHFLYGVKPNQHMKAVDYQPSVEQKLLPSPPPPLQPPVSYGYSWKVGPWTNCSAECDGGFKKRVVYCHSSIGQKVDDRYCTNNGTRPPDQINCANVRCPTWSFGQWSQCNDECKRSRQVQCLDHRGKPSDQCATKLKPPTVESCCNFKWRITCTGTCAANGRRTSQLICKQLFPKTDANPHPLKTGRKVDPKYCANRKRPSGSKLLKKCSKPCPFRWETSPWSKCNCKGKQHRSVKCYDEQLKVESNRCPEGQRPKKYIKCTPPPHCRNAGAGAITRSRTGTYRSCKDAQTRHRTDGEYMIHVNGTSVRIYCHGMATATPTEYLTLSSGPVENYAIYINRRAADANKCQVSDRDWTDETNSYGATHYRKIRVQLPSLQVITNDFQYTNSSGKKQSFGSAGDCYSNTGRCPQGDFAINLEGTPFRIRPRTVWKTNGVNAVIKFLVSLKPPYQKVRALCGGYCGSCSVSPETNLYLELI
ncbi:A disintegrin and metalloproteinase with thrombospondin motifs 9 isoform X3 [Anopheles aquasalis]|uniref:A disintegrin and metalloproteinase with thrombospondin motifs 9 isoform X3 n=1 Tax=Anopheles aquasalis TaxID=42839 RepID=UPI00215ADE70|nr:A disintegrin and metalloproteinase with thrombospondin motifs 9 isoform X3 [Anopheles aquasalis]